MAMCLTHAYFDKGFRERAVISGTHQLKSIRLISYASVAILYSRKRYQHEGLSRKDFRGCYHWSGLWRRKSLQLGTAQRNQSLVQPHRQCLPLRLSVRHLCGIRSSWLIRMSRSFFLLSSIQKKKKKNPTYNVSGAGLLLCLEKHIGQTCR